MKRITLAVATLLMMAGSAFCQTRPSNEVNFSYGIASLPSIAEALGGILGTAFSGGLVKVSDVSSSGAIGVEYIHYLNRHIGVGVLAIEEYTSLTFDGYSGKDENGNAIYKERDPQWTNYISFMPAVKVPWFYKDHVSMYSKLAGGIRIQGSSVEDVDKGLFPALQVNPVGIDFGSPALRGFVEVGFGMQGLLMGGLHYAF